MNVDGQAEEARVARRKTTGQDENPFSEDDDNFDDANSDEAGFGEVGSECEKSSRRSAMAASVALPAAISALPAAAPVSIGFGADVRRIRNPAFCIIVPCVSPDEQSRLTVTTAPSLDTRKYPVTAHTPRWSLSMAGEARS